MDILDGGYWLLFFVINMELGDRMKQYYEKPYNIQLPHRLPVIIRVDGKTFHTFTKDMERPFDDEFIEAMYSLALHLCEKTHTAQFAYTQSDEISLLLHPYKKLDTNAYFNNEIQKISSVTAGIASSFMTQWYNREAVFDARCFVLPEAEVVNYFLWRQQDATRNSISMCAQSLYSHKELHGKSSAQRQEMIFQKGLNWNDLPTYKKRGSAVVKSSLGWEVDLDIPIFSQDRLYIERLLEEEDE